jgi:hypothetical protein
MVYKLFAVHGDMRLTVFNVIEFSEQRRVGVDETTHALLRSRRANAMS